MKKNTYLASAAIALTAAMTLATPGGSARADLLIYEPFDYATGTLNGAGGGSEIGFDPASTWSYSGTQTATIAAGSILFADGYYQTSGNRTRYSSTLPATENIAASRPIDASASSGTLWVSFLTESHTASVPNVGKGIMLDESTLTTGGGDGRDFALFQKRNSTTAAGVQYGNALSDTADAFNDLNERYIVIGKFEDLGVGGATARMWGVTSGEFAVMYADRNITEAELNSIPVARRTTVVGGPATTLTASGFLNMVYVDFTNAVMLDFSTDEIRVGTTIQDVTQSTTNPPILDDHFANSTLGTGGPAAINGGFVKVSNNVGGSGSAAEAGTVATVTTTGVSNNSGLYSVSSLDLASSQVGFSATFVVNSVTGDPSANGIFLGITDDNTTFFRTLGSNFGFRIDADGQGETLDLLLVANDGGANNEQVTIITDFNLADLQDGFTATFSVFVDNTYTYAITGLGADVSGGGVLSGITFASQFDAADYVVASIQQGSSAVSLGLNRITVTQIVPAPAALPAGLAMMALAAARRRRHR